MGNIDFGPMIIMAMIGLGVCFVAVPAAALAIIVLPYCLWQHDFSVVLPAAGLGGAIGAAFFGWLFRHEFTFGRK